MKNFYIMTIALLGMLLAVPTTVAAQATSGKIYVGYAKYDDQIWEYDGLSLDHDAKVGCAILLTRDKIAPYAGGTIKALRVGWDTSEMTGQYEGFVRKTFNGEDLSTGKATVRFSYGDANPGWNNMTMTDYVIPDDVEQLVVGFTTTLKKDVCAIPTLYPHYVSNSCYLWVEGDNDADGNPNWVDMNDRGILPILLVVEDTQGAFQLVPVLTMMEQNGIGVSGEPTDCAVRLKNGGSQTISNIEVTSRQGEQTYSKKVNLSKSISTGGTSGTFLVPLTCFESGDVEFSITKVNGKALSVPVAKTVNMIAVPKDVARQFTRRPLAEYYESENNYRSPRYYDEYVGPMMKPYLDRVTFVSQHLDDQFMTGDDDATKLALQLCDNDSLRVSIPAMTIDRAMNTSNYLVQLATSKNPMFDVYADSRYFNVLMDAMLSEPTFVSVGAEGQIDEAANTISISVEGEIAEGVMPADETLRLTVYLMERDVLSDSQLFWTEEEKEENFGEYTHANVIREILLNADELPAGGTFTSSLAIDDPDPMWNLDNLYIVAFVHRSGKHGSRTMHVLNSCESQFTKISDGINEMENGKWKIENAPVYDLSGRKIENRKSVNRQLPKGIYIVNGKKYVVR